MNIRIFLILITLAAAHGPLLQAQVELIARPNQDTARKSGAISSFYEFSGKVYFNAIDNMGSAFYCSDGTADGTVVVTRDINPMRFTACGEWLYILGSKPQYEQLWDNPWGRYAIWRMKADGSERRKLVDLYRPYSMIWDTYFFWTAGNRVYYAWRGGLSWIDNATGKITRVFQGLKVEGGHLEDYYLEQMVLNRDGVFFLERSHTPENFFYADLESGVAVPLAKIKTGGEAYPMDKMIVFKNRCYVLHVADTVQLWVSDGTPDGTSLIWQNTRFEIIENPFTPFFLQSGDELLFDIPEKIDDTTWRSIYTCTDDEVQLLHRHPMQHRNLFTVPARDKLYVFIKDSSNPGALEVWLKDESGYRQEGTLTNSTKDTWIKSVDQVPGYFLINSDSLRLFDDLNFDHVFTSPTVAYSLDATTLGVFLAGYDVQITGPYLLKTDPPSCTMLKKLVSDRQYGSIGNLTPSGNQLFFIADSRDYGTEIWVTGGQAESTHLVMDINESGPTRPFAPVPYNNRMVFTAQGGSYENMDKVPFSGLWMTDGTSQGTVKLEDLMIREVDEFSLKAVWKDQIWFAGKPKDDPDGGWRLWVSDGKTGEARIFDAEFRDLHFNDVFALTAGGDNLYFAASDGVETNGLWLTDGTEAGTLSIDHLIGDSGYRYSRYFGFPMMAAASRLFFTRDVWRNDSIMFNREVWVTDGTSGGTRCIAGFGDDFTKNQSIRFLGLYRDSLVFTYSTPADGLELWLSGDPAGGPVQLTGGQDTGINPDKQFVEGVSFAGRFFLVSFTEENGYELWVTDGTADGTYIFIELAHGQKSTQPKELTVAGEKLFFFCDGEDISHPLWMTDGTPEGTEPLPWNFADLDNFTEAIFWQEDLFFVASHPETGQGLYRCDLAGVLGTGWNEKPEAEGLLTLYPNPAGDELRIVWADQVPSLTQGMLLTAEGRVAGNFTLENGSAVLPVANLPPGLYFIRVGGVVRPFIRK